LILLRKPSSSAIGDFLSAQRQLELTYDDIGATFGIPPHGYVVDHTRIEIGSGLENFEKARAAIQQWKQFDLGWVQATPRETPISQGEVVAIVAKTFGIWWLNACRIVITVDEECPRRFGFAYGTLPAHAESGEERFLVEMDEIGRVWFDIFAFSKPNQWLTKMGYPYARIVQKRFARQSTQHIRELLRAT
jgi:uncharacterized protein (UPF0548 family)